MYSVILPPGISFVSDESKDSGYHAEGEGNYFGVILNASIDAMTTTFCHEFVEAATDPKGDAWQVNPRDDSSWNEICDICENVGVVYINGVAVAPYFAGYVGGEACLVPMPPPPLTPPPVLPDGDYEITNADFRSISNINYIWAIGGPVGTSFWTLTTDDAIIRMQKGELTFYTISNGERTDVSVRHSLVASYLTTAPDDTKLNNLDYIATHHPLPEDLTFWQ